MSDTVIRVENLSKKYIIGHQQKERYTALREVIANRTKGIIQRLNPRSKRVDPNFEEFWALKDISFEIKQGDRVGIIGRNGAGKSTLLKILSRITEPTSGKISIKGRVASLLEVGTGFHPELTGRENVYLNGAILGMSKQEIRRKFDEIVAFAEIEKFLDTPVKRYSSGMYVRLAFAVAAHLEPEILVVDEVLAVGDAQFQKKCLGKMEDVSKEGRTVLFVSHNITALRSLCKTGILLKSGTLAIHNELDKVLNKYNEDIISSEILEKVWENPVDAPGNEYIRIKSIKAYIPSSDTENHYFTVQTPIDIKVSAWNYLPNVYLNFSISLFTLEGVCVFNTLSPSLDIVQGIIRGVFHIPANFLNDQTYCISIFLVKDRSVVLYKIQNVLSFKVNDIERNGAWYGKWAGVVRPYLHWETAFQEEKHLY